MECKHVWIGSTDGVTCKLCGEKHTHDEYVKLCKPKKKKTEK